MTAVPPTVPVLALKVASRIAIYISKESRALWRSVICRGKCYTELKVHLCSPTLIIHLWTDAQGEAGWDEMPGRTRFTPQICGRRKHCWRELPRPQRDRQCLELGLKLSWHWEEVKNFRRRQKERWELETRREGRKERDEKWERGREAGRQHFFSFPSKYLHKNKYNPALKWSVLPCYGTI